MSGVTHSACRASVQLSIWTCMTILLATEAASLGLGSKSNSVRGLFAVPQALIGRQACCARPSPASIRSSPSFKMISSESNGDGDDSHAHEEDTTSSTESQPSIETGKEKKGFWSNVFGTKKINRATLAKLGTSVMLSYGFVSNAFGCTAVSCAWYIASRRSGLSPMAPGEWKGFLSVYAGFFAFLNIIRPARFALSVYLSRYFEKAVEGMQHRFTCNKATAVGLVVFFVNICGSVALITIGIATASALSGVPVWITE